MQKVVIDTNVLVSALIQRSYPYLIIHDLFIEEKIRMCLSDKVMQEYYEVLNRKKFSRYPDFLLRAETLLADIEAKASKYKPRTQVKIIGDVNDNKFLELTIESKSDFLITGNTKDFTMKNYKSTKILTPKEYWDKHRPGA